MTMATRRVLSAARGVRSTPAADLIGRAQQATDVLVLGCGIAGCTVALRAAKQGLNVTMLTASKDPHDCNSYWAQGGIIYRAVDDTPDLLASDVTKAGAGMCVEDAVNMLANDGPRRVEEILIEDAEVPFDRDADDNLSLCLEASHNRPRIIYFKDQTGAAITESMLAATTQNERVNLVNDSTAVDLLTHDGSCVGAVVMDNTTGSTVAIPAKVTVLATGGLGDIYAHTSNPETARGDGFAMASRAGADLMNMEYVQFHPTTLYMPGERSFLLSEALRGVGARLIDQNGRAFAKEYHPDGELACRDIVSRMIRSEMTLQDRPCMYLDCSHFSAEYLQQRFPAISSHCAKHGLDISKDPLPVVPAAHYFCGGVKTDLEGRTSMSGLYAAGEVACTGLHGANRLASTSLLEGLVWGAAIVEHLGRNAGNHGGVLETTERCGEAYSHYEKLVGEEDGTAAANVAFDQVRQLMWDKVGVVRTPDLLDSAVQGMNLLSEKVEDIYHQSKLTPTTLGLRNATRTASLVADAARRNPESRGTHFMSSSA
eukprot:TRINITY_DN30075_c0_g1_i1.p1 TRINITY_DN30075_c0_g1~~TRINITY_DN30075_c0_g1_i1.p1  ORF type:complete len:542 (+),score=237.00 TRINITY_DN30075_c0_g1_i1:154-1779(+)